MWLHLHSLTVWWSGNCFYYHRHIHFYGHGSTDKCRHYSHQPSIWNEDCGVLCSRLQHTGERKPCIILKQKCCSSFWTMAWLMNLKIYCATLIILGFQTLTSKKKKDILVHVLFFVRFHPFWGADLFCWLGPRICSLLLIRSPTNR